jgi:tetratricopeptide (TPR) repeat protein
METLDKDRMSALRSYAWTRRAGKALVHIFIIALVGYLSYSNTFEVPFQWDEYTFIEDNPIVKEPAYFLTPSSAKEFQAYPFFKTRYVGYLTFALNYRLGGLDVRGYHAFNFAVHVLNALLVYLLVITTFSTPYLRRTRLARSSREIALLTGLVFISHPIQTEAVTYIFQRLASLSALFCLLSLTSYAGSRLSKGGLQKKLLCAASVASAALAMTTKESAFTLPLVIALYEFLFFGNSIRKKALCLIPILLTMLIVPVLHINPDMDLDAALESASRHETDMPRTEYLFTQFRVIMTYMRLLLLPVNQNLDYDYPVYRSFFEPPVFMSFLSLCGIFFFGVYLYHRSRSTDSSLRLVAFGILWFFVSLSVESSIIPLPMLISEYRVYMPSVGVFLAASAAVFLFIQRTGGSLKKTVAASMVLIPLVLSYNAYARNDVWKTRTSLWEDVVKKSPQNARGHNNLGIAYKEKGMLTEAIAHYKAALSLKPDYIRAHNNLGVAYKDKGMITEAIAHYKTALSLKPDYAKAHNNLGVAYYRLGRADDAVRHFQHALTFKPDFAEAHLNLGIAHKDSGLSENAIELFRTALKLKPDLDKARFNLGLIYYEKGLREGVFDGP